MQVCTLVKWSCSMTPFTPMSGYQSGLLGPSEAQICLGILSNQQEVVAPCGLDAYPYFVVGVLHLLSSAFFGFGGLYHAAIGPEILSTRFLAYEWQARNQMTGVFAT